MKVPKGQKVLIGNHKYKAGEDLPPNYKLPNEKPKSLLKKKDEK